MLIVSPVLRRQPTIWLYDGPTPRGFKRMSIAELWACMRKGEPVMFDSDELSTHLYEAAVAEGLLAEGNCSTALVMSMVAEHFGILPGTTEANLKMQVYNRGAHVAYQGAFHLERDPHLELLLRLSDNTQGLEFGFDNGCLVSVEKAPLDLNPFCSTGQICTAQEQHWLQRAYYRQSKPSHVLTTELHKGRRMSSRLRAELHTLEVLETRSDYKREEVWDYKKLLTSTATTLCVRNKWGVLVAALVVDTNAKTLDNIRVMPRYRQKTGLGKRLMTMAVQLGARHLQCEAAGLVNWYTELGWRLDKVEDGRQFMSYKGRP